MQRGANVARLEIEFHKYFRPPCDSIYCETCVTARGQEVVIVARQGVIFRSIVSPSMAVWMSNDWPTYGAKNAPPALVPMIQNKRAKAALTVVASTSSGPTSSAQQIAVASGGRSIRRAVFFDRTCRSARDPAPAKS